MLRVVFVSFLLLGGIGRREVRAQDTSLVGLWQSKRIFGPEVSGRLELTQEGDRWRATIGGRVADFRVRGDTIAFDVPTGTFKGRRARDRGSIAGQWIDFRRRITMPVTLTRCAAGPATPASTCYVGDVQPVEDEFTFYMDVKPRADGRLGAFLRNPERNQGRFIRLSHLARSGDTVYLRDARDTTIATGLLRQGRMSVFLRFATHDFQKVHPDSFTDFYPRGRPRASYTYAAPKPRNDGWSVGRARDAGFSEERLAEMIRMYVNASADTASAFRPHGILIARNGKLVLEEYFHGEHADKPHDTRSASKTVVTVVLGAAMQAGMKVSAQTPVFAAMGMASPSLDARKRAMTLHHLLTMSSGLDCHDNAPDYERYPGSEDVLTNQDTSPDWLRIVLDLKMLRDPGAEAIYCSINPFLAGEVIARVTGKSFQELESELFAVPLQIGRHSLLITPVGDSYLGGSARYTLRDFAKIAQLYANGGTWNGRRIVSEAWVRESAPPRYKIGRTFRQGPRGPTETSTNNYGYLWWTTEFEHQGRIVVAHHASGNGGQYSMYIPELGVVIAVYGGNYADPNGFYALRELVPKYILPALER
jgi:CubicO group peptidase (beta-lactamase class C family)